MINFLNENLSIISYLIAVIIFLSPFYLKKRFSKNHIIGLTITLGIFGTFLGVFIGLLDFNTENITQSIPVLLNGLKTAFVTSIAGMLANIILKVRPTFYGFHLLSAPEKTEDTSKLIIMALQKLTHSISGDDDSTMVTQLQKIRTTNSDGLEKLNKSFIEFAEKMVADNTQSLIDALTEVMKDFNSKINEQFGENFKELNKAVEAMLSWQKEYKTQVETVTEKFKLISSNLNSIDNSIKETAKSHTVIYKTNELLSQLLKDLSIEVSSFAEIGIKAKENFPLIENNLNKLIRTSTEYVNNQVGLLNNQYEEFSNSQEQIHADYRDKLEQITELTTSNFNKFSSNQERLAISFEENLRKMINDNAERIQKLDIELGQELNKALESLGSNLTSLSQHFVNDYKPLTEKLQKIVELSKGVSI
jgi:DNA anti-recombination protein RmuC